MSLLLNTDIDVRVREAIRGFVARAGGTADQLVDYRGCRVEDINIPDGGFGALNRLSSRRTLSLKLFKQLKQEVAFLFLGPRIPRDRKTVVLDMHGAYMDDSLQGRYDCSISSNMLEHSPNPVFLLLNFYRITREDGFQFHAIPHHRHTYDRFREPTEVGHMLEDFVSMADETDTSHVEDYVQSAIEKDGWQREFHKRYPLRYPFIHFHVFDERNTRELMEVMFEEVTNDILKTDRFSDNVVLFRNSLKPSFLREYRSVIDRYSPQLVSTGAP